MFAWTALLVPFASAQESVASVARHPEVPAGTVAAEDGPGAQWVSPANPAFDPDPRFGLYVDHNVGGATTGAATVGAVGQTLGMTLRSDTGDMSGSVDLGSSFELPSRLAVGGLVRWHFGDARGGPFAFDLGASWRPTRWLGVAGAVQNIGQPDPAGLIQPVSRVGLALHPIDAIVVGAEYALSFDSGRAPDLQVLRFSALARVTDGLALRAFSESALDGSTFTGGAAVEVTLGGLGLGVGGRSGDGDSSVTGWLGSTGPAASLIAGHNTLAVADLTRPPPLQEPSTILSPSRTWLDVLEDLQTTSTDPRFAGVVLELGSGLGYARATELRARIAALEAAGRPVTVILTGTIDTSTYFAAAEASQIVMHPASVLDLTGIALEVRHFRKLMDEVGIEAQVVRRSEFKSAAEMYTETQASPEQEEQLTALLDDVYAALVDGIASSRELSAEEVRARIDGGPYLSEEAVENGLVDEVAYPDELEARIRQRTDRSRRFVALETVSAFSDPWGAPRGVAVVYVDGAIMTGRSSSGGLLSSKSAGSTTVVQQIDRARRDPSVGALVLRVDSPGGSAYASEQITRAVQRFKGAGKPVVVSMGAVAASGGYYVATYADRIWAHPSTITGSIGVISSKISADAMLAWLGVGVQSFERGANAGINRSLSAWDDEERARSEALVDGMYARFKGHVEKGREMTPEKVEEVARGRVWSGAAAHEKGLVDELGGLLEAIADARERADLREDAPTVVYPPSADLLDLVGSPLPALRVKDGTRTPSLLEPLGAWATILAHPEERVWVIEPMIGELK